MNDKNRQEFLKTFSKIGKITDKVKELDIDTNEDLYEAMTAISKLTDRAWKIYDVQSLGEGK